MKVVKAEDVVMENPTTETENPANQIDQARIAEAQEKFDRTRQILETKEYGIALTEEQTKFFMEDFFQNVSWKGYESYAIAETHKAMKSLVKDGTLAGNTKVEIIEAIFHFLKNHVSTGIDKADMFRQVCDQFAISMKEINDDRQELRDLSLELVAAEQGITVEQVEAAYAQQQGLQPR